MSCNENCKCYMNPDRKCPHFDMTNLPRITITDSMTPSDKALFEGYNANCEAVEDLWIELDFQMWEQMEAASKKLRNRRAEQRDRDNRNHVKQLHKQGFSLAEIASITRLDHGEIYDMVHSKRKTKDIFDDCPEEILADLQDEFDLS